MSVPKVATYTHTCRCTHTHTQTLCYCCRSLLTESGIPCVWLFCGVEKGYLSVSSVPCNKRDDCEQGLQLIGAGVTAEGVSIVTTRRMLAEVQTRVVVSTSCSSHPHNFRCSNNRWCDSFISIPFSCFVHITGYKTYSFTAEFAFISTMFPSLLIIFVSYLTIETVFWLHLLKSHSTNDIIFAPSISLFYFDSFVYRLE